ncbi:MAG: hypothetical protein MUC83_02305, partial [Pirellula sp.]|nr:hypothetical protein [Pirellula sp.]
MFRRHCLIAVLAIFAASANWAATNSRVIAQTVPSRPLSELRILYVGNERAENYIEFLEEHVEAIEAVSRSDFQPKQASQFDVVLFDWPQNEETREMRKLHSPLGNRAEWDRPTVLLGSAGLNLAVAWKLQGGSGCTCMDPIAYGFRDHEIFKHPKKIQLEAQIRIPTPAAFQDELSEIDIEVLPLVDDYKKNWKAGWCTYSNYFRDNPDVEFFC